MPVHRRLRQFGAALALCLLLPMLAFGQSPDRLKVSDNKRFLVTNDGKPFFYLGDTAAADVRRPLYWDLFSGAFGHTYGHHSVWQFWQSSRTPVNNPLLPWTKALDQPGANQMKYARRLLESRPFLSRLPDDSLIVAGSVPTAVRGAGRYRFAATRDADGSYALVYVPSGRPFKVRMDKISGDKVKAWWFNPRDGAATAAGEFDNRGERDYAAGLAPTRQRKLPVRQTTPTSKVL